MFLLNHLPEIRVFELNLRYQKSIDLRGRESKAVREGDIGFNVAVPSHVPFTLILAHDS
jgi:hypothetical protein